MEWKLRDRITLKHRICKVSIAFFNLDLQLNMHIARDN